MHDCYYRDQVYVPGDKWCSEAIKLAVVKAGYDFEKLELWTDLDLKATLKRGQYLIDGVQNRHWCMRGVKYTNSPEYTGPGPAQNPGVIQNGRGFGPRTCASPSVSISISRPHGCGGVAAPFLQR